MEGEPGGAGNEPAPRPHAAASEPSKAAEESQAAPAGKAGSDATEGAAVVAGSPGAAGAASATAGLQSGWNQMQQGQLPAVPPPGYQAVMPGGMVGMLTPDGLIPGSASL